MELLHIGPLNLNCLELIWDKSKIMWLLLETNNIFVLIELKALFFFFPLIRFYLKSIPNKN